MTASDIPVIAPAVLVDLNANLSVTPSSSLFSVWPNEVVQRFSVVPVTTDKLLKEFGRLAYDEYVVRIRRGYQEPFEKASDWPEGLMLDQFDTLGSGTTHSLVLDMVQGEFVACVRVITARGDLENLPLKKETEQCGLKLPQVLLDNILHAGEVSRFLISAGRAEQFGLSDPARDEVSRCLIAAIMISANRLDLKFYASFCDRALRRGLSRFSVNWRPLCGDDKGDHAPSFRGRKRVLSGGPKDLIHEEIEEAQYRIRELVRL